jgi:hypothetical protein
LHNLKAITVQSRILVYFAILYNGNAARRREPVGVGTAQNQRKDESHYKPDDALRREWSGVRLAPTIA